MELKHGPDWGMGVAAILPILLLVYIVFVVAR